MAYDEELASRVRELVSTQGRAEEKKMFGGLGFLVGGHLAVCASHDGGLLVRTDGTDVTQLLLDDHVEPMVMGGRESKTWLRVAPGGVRTERQLEAWVRRGVTTASSFPPKD